MIRGEEGMTRVLLVGLQPEAVDYSDPALPTRYGCKEDSGWTRWRETACMAPRTDKVGQPVRRGDCARGRPSGRPLFILLVSSPGHVNWL